MLSLREDLIGAEYTQELKKLQDHARPIPYSEVHKVIQQAFGQSPQNLFKAFEKKKPHTLLLPIVYHILKEKVYVNNK